MYLSEYTLFAWPRRFRARFAAVAKTAGARGFVSGPISYQCRQLGPRIEATPQGKSMRLSDQGWVVFSLIRIAARWLAGKILKGHGVGLVGDAALRTIDLDVALGQAGGRGALSGQRIEWSNRRHARTAPMAGGRVAGEHGFGYLDMLGPRGCRLASPVRTN